MFAAELRDEFESDRLRVDNVIQGRRPLLADSGLSVVPDTSCLTPRAGIRPIGTAWGRPRAPHRPSISISNDARLNQLV
jgi:hypothetical protein